jgi:hypothetical protein
MNLNPDENEYLGRLKDAVEYYLFDSCGSTLYAKFVKDLKLNPEETEILSLHFFNPFDLDLSGLDETDKSHLESLLFKYCRLDLKCQAEKRR